MDDYNFLNLLRNLSSTNINVRSNVEVSFSTLRMSVERVYDLTSIIELTAILNLFRKEWLVLKWKQDPLSCWPL